MEPAVSPRVRRAFGLLERFTPAAWVQGGRRGSGARRRTVGISTGRAAGRFEHRADRRGVLGSRHRVAGRSWGAGPAGVPGARLGGCRAHLAVFVKPLVERRPPGHRVRPAPRRVQNGAMAPGRTTIVECAEAVRAMVDAARGDSRAPSWDIHPPAPRPRRWRRRAAHRSAGWCPGADGRLPVVPWISSPIVTARGLGCAPD